MRNSQERNNRLENLCWRIWNVARQKKQVRTAGRRAPWMAIAIQGSRSSEHAYRVVFHMLCFSLGSPFGFLQRERRITRVQCRPARRPACLAWPIGQWARRNWLCTGLRYLFGLGLWLVFEFYCGVAFGPWRSTSSYATYCLPTVSENYHTFTRYGFPVALAAGPSGQLSIETLL